LLLVTPQAANKTLGQGGFQEVEQMALFKDMVAYQEEVRDRIPRRRSSEPRHPSGKTRQRACTDQHAARFLDAGHRYRPSAIVDFERPSGGDSAARFRKPRFCSACAKFPVILNGAGVVLADAIGARWHWQNVWMRLSACGYQHNDAFPGSHPPFRRTARIQRIKGGDAADRARPMSF
jgi:sulfoacetaldehyde acetyltransferase